MNLLLSEHIEKRRVGYVEKYNLVIVIKKTKKRRNIEKNVEC